MKNTISPQVFNFFKERISQQYPKVDEAEEENRFTNQTSDHMAFMEVRAKGLLGRDKELDRVISACMYTCCIYNTTIIPLAPVLFFQ